MTEVPWRWWMPLGGLLAVLAAAGLVLSITVGIAGADVHHPGPTVNLVTTYLQDLMFIGAAVGFAALMARPTRAQFGVRAVPWRRTALIVVGAYLAFLGASYAYTRALDVHDKQKLTTELGAHHS